MFLLIFSQFELLIYSDEDFLKTRNIYETVCNIRLLTFESPVAVDAAIHSNQNTSQTCRGHSAAHKQLCSANGGVKPFGQVTVSNGKNAVVIYSEASCFVSLNLN